MMTFLSEGLGWLAFRLGVADERVFELEEQLRRAREATGPAWLKASEGDLAEAIKLKCARLEKDAGDAEADCRQLRRQLDTHIAVIQESDAESLDVVEELRVRIRELEEQLQSHGGRSNG